MPRHPIYILAKLLYGSNDGLGRPMELREYTAQLECGRSRTITQQLAITFMARKSAISFCDECWMHRLIVTVLDWPGGQVIGAKKV